MCICTPEMRTPFCGKPGCEWPEQKQEPDAQEVKITVTVRVGTEYRKKALNAQEIKARSDFRRVLSKLEQDYEASILRLLAENIPAIEQAMDSMNQVEGAN